MKNIFIATMLLTVLIFGIYGCSGKSDVTGIWKGKVDLSDTNMVENTTRVGSTDPIELMLAQSDKTISGKITIASKTLTISSGLIVDKTLSFEADPLKIDANVNGNSIEGKINATYNDYIPHTLGAVPHKITGSFNVTKQ